MVKTLDWCFVRTPVTLLHSLSDRYNWCKYFYFLTRGFNIVNWIHRTPTHNIRENWTVLSIFRGIISSVHRNLNHWRSNQRPQVAVPKLYNWATSSHRTQVTPNQLVTVIARPNNLNVSCKLHPYSFLRTRSPPPTQGHVFCGLKVLSLLCYVIQQRNRKLSIISKKN